MTEHTGTIGHIPNIARYDDRTVVLVVSPSGKVHIDDLVLDEHGHAHPEDEYEVCYGSGSQGRALNIPIALVRAEAICSYCEPAIRGAFGEVAP